MAVADNAQLIGADWDVPRPVTTSRHMIEAARSCGVAASDCLAGTGLTLADIENTATEVQASQELAVLRNILARVPDPHEYARDVGLQYNIANMGIFGYALLASSNLSDAVNVGCRFAVLSSSYLRVTRHNTATGAIIEFDNSHMPSDVREFMVERDLHALFNLGPLLLGQLESDKAIRVELPGIEPPWDRFDFAGLNIEIDTSSTRSAIIIPNEVLHQAMPAADAATAAMCVQQCEDLLQARRQRRGTAALVRTRLVRDPGRQPSMAAIAGELCISERTLNRRLAAENTSYRLLIDEVRATLAAALLESGLTVEQTARQLGYSETAAFTRAFIRWTGTRPSRHRGTASPL
ncbi:AraC family transcriptional regulator [Mycolicibacterium aubagnense]|nr:AraC family transcriptional regulator [Mycolicibacterium aubagnense]TLH65626.1 AraC family transcriptional regulator [Mycolicibacterium aubagnense]